MAAPTPALPFYPLMFRNATLRLVALQTVPLAVKVPAAAEISRWCAEGALRHPPLHVLPLAAIVEAHELVEGGAVIGKVVLEIE
jgi:NADPH2:quinone reductase